MDMKRNVALLAKYIKRLYKPTNNNLRTSSNSRNKTENTTPRYNNDNQSGQFRNQRTMTVAGARETESYQEKEKKFFPPSTTATAIGTECANERDALANLIANLTLDTEENKTILKSIIESKCIITLELEECKTNLDDTSKGSGEATILSG
ncbi:hypothetical protein Tco_0355235 [Tanacetum coccineum]